MEKVKIRILGLSATPIMDGNCDKLVQCALKTAEELGGVETEFITTADKEIKVCKHCQWCIENRAPCKFKDDVHEILDRIERCDGLIIGSPTWINSLSPFLLNIFSRARYQVFFTNKFRNKVAGLLTLGFFGIGLERAIDIMRNVVIAFNIIPVAEATTLSSTAAYGERPAYMEKGVLGDEKGINNTKNVSTRVVELSRMIKYARLAEVGLPEHLQHTVVGGNVKKADQKIFVDGVWRDKQ